MKRYLASLPLLLASLPSLAQSPLTGTWQVVEARPAPWFDVKNGKSPIHPEIAKATLVFADQSVQGPQPLGCAKVKFTVSTVGPESLFQGGLKNPKSEAADLGFKGEKITSVNESCVRTDADVEMDYALIDADTAVFGLDNAVYKMRRAR